MYIEQSRLETQRPVTMFRKSNPLGNRLMGHLTNWANFLTIEGLPRVPVISELTGTLGGVVTVASEMIGHSSAFNPDLFWGRVDRNLKSVVTGKGQMTDMSPLLNAWFDVIVSHFKSSEMDGYAADFTLTGMNAILARMNAPSMQSSANMELTEKMKEAYGQIYRKLVTSDALKGGWNQIHADYSQRISSTGADVNVPNPKTTVDGATAPSGIVSMFSTELSHGTFGVNGTFGKYLTDANGKHIFETEWENFVGSQQFLTQPIETKAKLLVEAREVFPAAFKEAKNPHLAAALQKAYVQASAIVVNRDYAIFRTRVMTKANITAESANATS
ncbi:MAG: hypothetical protein NTZ55_02495, partial [Candidatus Roizmanbacteria bacterium]|nr:hypothetical protein [Candidatus Roizmanbacteria bacterium]